MLKLTSIAVALVSVAACSKKDEGVKPAAKAAPEDPITKSGDNTATKVGLDTGGKALGGEDVKLDKLKFGGSNFEGQFNEALDSWTFEKWEAQKDGTNDNVMTIYVNGWSSDEWPVDIEAFAAKLAEPDFLDAGSKWTKIESKTAYEGGWVITGETTDSDETQSAFAVRVNKLNALCRGYAKNTAKDKAATITDAIEACKGSSI